MAEKRKLGSGDLSVTAVGLGCMGFPAHTERRLKNRKP